VADIGLHLETTFGSCDLPLDSRLEEFELVEGLRSGDEWAYEALIRRFQHPVYNLVFRLLSDPSEANDVVQEVFLKVFRNVNSFRSQSSLKTWVFRIAVNEVHNQRRWFFRHRKQEVGLERDEEERGYQNTLPDPGPSPFQAAVDEEAQEILEEALQSLSPTYRAAVILRDVEDLSYEEIATVLEVNLGTVKSRIMRGRDALRHALTARLAPVTKQGARLKWTPQPAD
jgi:RNA polymerase sigma-70 factor, ECF subfamily